MLLFLLTVAFFTNIINYQVIGYHRLELSVSYLVFPNPCSPLSPPVYGGGFMGGI